jgi:hypothetical protein
MLVVIRLMRHVHMARDLRETRIYTLNTTLENKSRHPTTNTAYVS